MGIDVVGESQLVGYPTQFPSVTMLDWTTGGKPNARYWVLKLLRENFGPGDTLAPIRTQFPYIYAMAVTTQTGDHRLLLINKESRSNTLTVAGAKGASEQFIELGNAFAPANTKSVASDSITLGGYSVAVITLPR